MILGLNLAASLWFTQVELRLANGETDRMKILPFL
jgi:hypothetical protein